MFSNFVIARLCGFHYFGRPPRKLIDQNTLKAKFSLGILNILVGQLFCASTKAIIQNNGALVGGYSNARRSALPHCLRIRGGATAGLPSWFDLVLHQACMLLILLWGSYLLHPHFLVLQPFREKVWLVFR